MIILFDYIVAAQRAAEAAEAEIRRKEAEAKAKAAAEKVQPMCGNKWKSVFCLFTQGHD